MKRYLIDTDVLIDHLRGENKARDFLHDLRPSQADVCCSAISMAEIYSGIKPKEKAAVTLLFKSMNEIRVDRVIAEAAGGYRRKFYTSHGLLLPDALIAASAKTIDATLVTLNKKHFPMPDLDIQVPYVKK